MATTIGVSSITYDAGIFAEFESSRDGRALVQTIVGEPPTQVITPRASGPRRGRLTVVPGDLAAAITIEAMLAGAGPFTLTDPDITLTFVVPDSGRVRVTRTDKAWRVEVDFLEVLP